MKQFNLKDYLANPNQKVVTKDGKDVRIICTDVLGKYPIVALIKSQNTEFVYSYSANGSYNIGLECDRDLFFASNKQVRWLNIYSDKTHRHETIVTYKTREEALEGNKLSDYVTTIKIEWEE